MKLCFFFLSFIFLGLVGKFYVGCFFKYNEVFEGGNEIYLLKMLCISKGDEKCF